MGVIRLCGAIERWVCPSLAAGGAFCVALEWCIIRAVTGRERLKNRCFHTPNLPP